MKRRNLLTLLEEDEGSDSPTWINRFRESGTNALEATITINSLSATPSVRYRGCDATATEWPAWGYGDTLTLSGSGTAPTLQVPVPFVNNYDYGVRLVDGGKYYEAASSTTGDIGEEDFILELVFRTDTAVGTVQRDLIHKHDPSGSPDSVGWYVRDRNDATSTFFDIGIDATGTGVTNPATDYVRQRCWYHFMIFVDRNAYYRSWVNGQYSFGGGLTAGQAASMANSAKFRIGKATNQSASTICYFAMWKRAAGWFTLNATPGTDDNAANLIARDRFQKLCGIWPQKALGTARPTTAQRAGQAPYWIRKYVSGSAAYFGLGTDQTASYTGTALSADASSTIVHRWMRVGEYKDAQGNILSGCLIEPSFINLCASPRDFNTTWTKTNCTVTVNDDRGVDDATFADALVEDATNGVHTVSQSITLAAATYTFSVFAKAGTRNFVRMQVAGMSASCYFNLSTGAVGTAANCTGQIEACVNSWYRCTITYTEATGAARVHTIGAASADSTDSYQGVLSDKAVYLDFGNVYLGNELRMPTSTTTATGADNFVCPGGDNVGGASAFNGNVSLRVRLQNIDKAANNTILTLADGGDAADRVEIQVLAASDVASATVANGAVTVTDATPVDICDGNEHQVRLRARSADTAIYVDGEMRTKSTAAATPTADCDEIHIGEEENGASGTGQLGGYISEVRIYG